MGVPSEVPAPRWGMRQQVPPRRRGESRALWVLSLIVAAAGALLAVITILIPAGRTGYTTMHHPSGGMEPTVPANTDVTVRDLSSAAGAGGTQVKLGDVVLAAAPDWGLGGPVLQRVVGVGGDHIVLPVSGDLIRNGKRVQEPYLYDGIANGLPQAFDITVPKGRILLLGDHRADCMDSRFHLEVQHGTLAQSAVLGVLVPAAEVPAPERLWTWVGAGVAVIGLVCALFAFLAWRRRTALPPASPVTG